MIDLQVLGRLELRDADGKVLHSVLAQPKRQALLVYLAVAVPRGYHRRDTLVSLLWPESDDEHARGSLSKAVSHLRQSLGADALLSRGHLELGLDWHLVWCDAVGFEDALDRGALPEAMALYRGDLLPGFHVDEAPGLDQWLERERARLRGRAVQAATQLSESEEAAGRMAPSIEWARRAAALEPFDESSLRRVLTVLDRAGDRAGALREYDEFAARLRADLDADPAPETTALVDAIRNRPAGAPAPVPAPVHAASDLAPSPAPSPAPVASRAQWRPGRGAVVLAAAVMLAAAAWALLRPNPLAQDGSAPVATVAVVPFLVEGTPAVANLGDGIVSLLTDRFNHERDASLRALDARAVRRASRAVAPSALGADTARARLVALRPRFVLLGQIAAGGDSLRISAALYDSAGKSVELGEPTARAEVRGAAADVARLAGDLVWQILANHASTGAARFRPVVGELTPSLVALRSFLAAEQELIAGRFAEATKAYKAAVDADTTFGLAYFNLSRAANWAGDNVMAEHGLQRALHYIDRLAGVDQLRLRAWEAYQRGEPVVAERFTRLVLINDVGSADAWYDLGELQFHWGPLLGWTTAEARRSYEQSLAIGPNDAGTMVHLARIAASEGRVAAVDSLTRRATARGVDAPQALELRALRAYAHGDRAGAAQVHAEIARLDDAAALSVVTTAVVHGAAYARPPFPEALRVPRRGARLRASVAIFEAQSAMAHGRSQEAVRQLTAAAGGDMQTGRALEYRAAFAALPFRATSRDEAAALRAELLAFRDAGLIGPTTDQIAVNSIYPARRQYLLAMLSLKAGDTTSAMRHVEGLDPPVENTTDQAHRAAIAKLIRAEILRARGRSAEALTVLGTPTVLPGRVLPGVLDYPSAHERFLRAGLARDLGRWGEAIRWLGTFPDPAGYDVMYLPAVRAELGAAADARAKAQR